MIVEGSLRREVRILATICTDESGVISDGLRGPFRSICGNHRFDCVREANNYFQLICR